MSVEYDERSPSTSRASAAPVTSQMSIPRNVTSFETGSCSRSSPTRGTGSAIDPVERPGQAVGDAVELGEVDAAGSRDELAAHDLLDSIQQRHEERVRGVPLNPVSGTVSGTIFRVGPPQASARPDAARATISASVQAPWTPGAATR